METLQFNALTYMLKYDHSMIFKIPWDFRKEKKKGAVNGLFQLKERTRLNK